MDTVKLNIILPKKLVKQLDKLVGSRKKSRFITEVLTQKIEKIQNKELQKRLEDGYKATKQDSHDMVKEFEHIDLEGWDEY